MTESSTFSELDKQLDDLTHRWLNLAAQARKRATDKPKGELFALYDKATAEAYELTAGDLAGLLNKESVHTSDDFLAHLYSLTARWDALAVDAQARAATTSLGGAHHFGTAASLQNAVNDLRAVVGSRQQR